MGIKIEALIDVLKFQARKDFLLLTISPDRVRDQLVREFQGQTCIMGQSTPSAQIVAKPE